MGAEESSRVIPTTWKSAMLKILTFKSLWFNRLACTPQVRHPVLGWKPYPSIQKKRTSFWEGAHHGNQSTWQVFSQACWGLEMDHVFWNYAYTLLTQSLKCDIPPVRKPSQKGRLWKKKITEGTWSMPHMELKKKHVLTNIFWSAQHCLYWKCRNIEYSICCVHWPSNLRNPRILCYG